MQKGHIFYVEDDMTLSFLAKDNLEANDYKVTHCENGLVAWETFKNNTYDLCILDVMLPEMDGFELARNIRSINDSIPILFLTAKSLREDKIEGLKIGADDYILKPFNFEELLLKVDVFMRRRNVIYPSDKNMMNITSQSVLDYKNLTLQINEDEKVLTQKEADLLKMFIENKNATLKRAHILERVWGEDDYFFGRSLDVFISRLRKYLQNDESVKIANVHGVGFKLDVRD